MTTTRRIGTFGYWTLTTVLFVAGAAMLVWYTPEERTMGQVQKIFYFHMPVAINTFVACFICFLASGAYLFQRRQKWDDLAVSSARVALLLCSLVLLTGMIWGRSYWGVWWTWSPRLTFSLALWLLYAVYLIIRPSIPSRERRAFISAVYAVVAFLDVPLVYLSVRLMPDIHPTQVTLEPAMKLTLMFWFLPVTMLSLGLIAACYARQRRAGRPEVAADTDIVLPALRSVGGAS